MSTNTSSIAERYARALFIVTERRGETAAALADLGGVNALLARGSRIARFLDSPEVSPADKRELLRHALEKRVARSVVVFVDLLLRKKRLRGLPDIVTEFEALVERAQGILRAQLVSAVPFGQAELARVQKELETSTGSRIKLTNDIDERLIGGALVRIGDRVLDRSVASLLAAIAERLHHANV